MRTPAARALRASAVMAIWVACAVAFLWIQHRLSVNGHFPLSGDPGPGGAADAIDVDMRLGALRFAGASLAMAALILGAGRRLLFGLPVVLTTVLPAVSGGIFDCWSWDQARLPHGLGAAWRYTSSASGCISPFQAGWLGVTVDLGLVLLPAIALALLRPGRRAGSGAGPIPTAFALASCALVLAFLLSVRGFTYAGEGWLGWLAFHGPLVAFGALLGLRRSWWSVALVVVPVTLFPLLATTSVLPIRPDALGILYLIGITLLGAAWRPLAVALEHGGSPFGRLREGRVAAPAGS